jgi:L-threonylcarbamoyladenylate synthase
MQTKVAVMSEEYIIRESMEEAGSVIRTGGLVVFPTETVYGLGANALDSEAVKGIFKAKGRPQDNPLIVHVADMNIEDYVEDVPEAAKHMMESFWPGPLTIILKKSLKIPYETSAGLETVGIRMPDNKIALELIKSSGVPIAAPSANISGRPSPTELSRCVEDLEGRVNYIIGGDRSKVGLESTIIDCTVEPPCILRPGGVTLEMLRKIDEDIYIDPVVMEKLEENIKPKAPGMKYRHYAPSVPVKIIDGDLQKTIAKINEIVQNYIGDKKTVGIMATDESKDYYKFGIVISLGSRKKPESIGKNLFEVLRTLDDKKVDVIVSEGIPEEGVGVAVMNRLKKAAAYDVLKV